MYPILQVFGLSIQSYGLALIAAGWLGLSLAEREVRRLDLGGDRV